MPIRYIRSLLSVVLALVMLEFGSAVAQQALGSPPNRAATVEVNGIEVHYRIVGSGPPLLLLHGFTGAGSWWDPVVDDLSEHHTLIIPDLPLHGRSTGREGPYRFDHVATDLYALMDELGFGRFRAAGYSAGGIALSHMLTQQPNRIESAALLSAPRLTNESILAFPAFEDHPAGVQDYWFEVHPGGEAQVRRLIAAFHGLADAEVGVNVVPEQLSNIEARTLLIVGDRDPVLPLEMVLEMFRAIPDAALWVVPGRGHSPLLPNWGGSPEARRIFPDVVREFLEPAEVREGESGRG